MTQMTNLRLGLVLIGLSVGLFELAPLVQAQNIAVNARVQNVGIVHIGDVTWNSAGGVMSAVFRFRGNWGNELDPHYDFRWFQIIKDYDGPQQFRWNYADQNPGWVPANFPAVDPPRGGWRYQYGGGRNPTNRQPGDGADNSPYYENDDNGDRYYYPNFADRHREREFSWFDDAPGHAINFVHFQTFLVVVLHGNNTFQQGQRNFLKLVGFKWEFRRGVISEVAEVNLARKKDAIRNALNNSGFNDWNSLQWGDFELVPEPTSLLVLAVGLAGLAYRHRRAA